MLRDSPSVPKGILPMSAVGTEPQEMEQTVGTVGPSFQDDTSRGICGPFSSPRDLTLQGYPSRVHAVLHKGVCFWVCCPQVDNDSTDSTIHGGFLGRGHCTKC